MQGLKNVRTRRTDALTQVGWDQLESLLAVYYRGQGYTVDKKRCQGQFPEGQFPENAGQRSPGKRSAPGALSAQHRRDISRVRPLALPGLREKVSGTVSLERGQTPEKRSRVHLDSSALVDSSEPKRGQRTFPFELR